MREMILDVHVIEPTDEDGFGHWCESCSLPSAIRFRLALVGHDNLDVTAWGQLLVCDVCGWCSVPPRPDAVDWSPA